MANSSNSGKIRLGLVIFVFLLGLLAGQFTYRYLTRANRFNDEAVELMNQGKYDSALVKLDEALLINPDHALANFHRGLCLVEKHRWDEAVDSFRQALRFIPEKAEVNFELGKTLWTKSRFTEALAPLEKAVELKIPYPDAWVLLAECHYENYLLQRIKEPDKPGDPTRAITAFKTYLSQRAGAQDRSMVERKLLILKDPSAYPEVLERRKKSVDAGNPSGGKTNP